jgi:hypothetical protein
LKHRLILPPFREEIFQQKQMSFLPKLLLKRMGGRRGKLCMDNCSLNFPE